MDPQTSTTTTTAASDQPSAVAAAGGLEGADAGTSLRLPSVQRSGSSRMRHYSNYSNGRGSEDVDSLTYSQDGSSVRIRRDGTGTSSMRSGTAGNLPLTPSDSPLLNSSPTQGAGPGRAVSTASAGAGVGINGEPLTVGSANEGEEAAAAVAAVGGGGLGKKAKREISDGDDGFDDDDWDDEVLYYGKNDKVRDDKDDGTAKSACCGCTIM